MPLAEAPTTQGKAQRGYLLCADPPLIGWVGPEALQLCDGEGRARGRLEEVLGAAVEEDEVGPEGPSAAHPKFAPIPSQREIIEAERAQLAEPAEPHWAITLAGAVLRGIWAGAVAVGGALARTIRSRLARREDEAL